jgi:hypothetical protein
MRWFKVIAIVAGILVAYFAVSAVIGLVFELFIAALVVGAIVVAVNVALSRKQVHGRRADREIREPRDYAEPSPPRYSAPPRPADHDVDDDLARLKREMGG